MALCSGIEPTAPFHAASPTGTLKMPCTCGAQGRLVEFHLERAGRGDDMSIRGFVQFDAGCEISRGSCKFNSTLARLIPSSDSTSVSSVM